MKRGLSVYAALIVLTSFLVPNVLAYFDTSSPQGMIQSVIQSVTDIASPIFSSLLGSYSSNDFLFVKILLFLLLFVVIKQSVKSFPKLGEQNMVVNIISFVVSILAVRFMPDSTIMHDLLLPYSTLGITILTVIPFLVWFYFVQTTMNSGLGRRLAWSLFMLVMFILWISRMNELSSTGNYIYLGILGLGILFLIFDKAIHGYFKKWEIDRFYVGANQRTVAALQAEYLNIINVDSPQAEARRHAIETRLHHLGANLP